MAKLTKEELIKKISEIVSDNEVQIELLEDVTDSFVENEPIDTTELDELKVKYEELQEKYRQRFLEVEEVVEEVEDLKNDESSEELEEVKEDEVIDIEEI